MIKRDEHLEWCKQRANEYIDRNDLKNAFASFQSDMGKHPETSTHLSLEMGTMLMLGGHLSTQLEMRNWVNGTN